ncbi:hypothetical protein L7F22_043118 [Adiantum nelumboides]|nr:hypothetical protein [Adiantum nelumboides]
MLMKVAVEHAMLVYQIQKSSRKEEATLAMDEEQLNEAVVAELLCDADKADPCWNVIEMESDETRLSGWAGQPIHQEMAQAETPTTAQEEPQFIGDEAKDSSSGEDQITDIEDTEAYNFADEGQGQAQAAAEGQEQAQATHAGRGRRFAGFIFLCNNETQTECFLWHVFGLPAYRKALVRKVKIGMTLFLFNTQQKVLLGIFQAISNGGTQLELPKNVFQNKFKARVLFREVCRCHPLTREEFEPVLSSDNYNQRLVDHKLTDDQVQRLILAFRRDNRPQYFDLREPERYINHFTPQYIIRSAQHLSIRGQSQDAEGENYQSMQQGSWVPSVPDYNIMQSATLLLPLPHYRHQNITVGQNLQDHSTVNSHQGPWPSTTAPLLLLLPDSRHRNVTVGPNSQDYSTANSHQGSWPSTTPSQHYGSWLPFAGSGPDMHAQHSLEAPSSMSGAEAAYADASEDPEATASTREGSLHAGNIQQIQQDEGIINEQDLQSQVAGWRPFLPHNFERRY